MPDSVPGPGDVHEGWHGLGACTPPAVQTCGGGVDGVELADFDEDGLLYITTGGVIRMFLHSGYASVTSEWLGVHKKDL